jgi:hypothetical protein
MSRHRNAVPRSGYVSSPSGFPDEKGLAQLRPVTDISEPSESIVRLGRSTRR